jgi:hypothetical protein
VKVKIYAEELDTQERLAQLNLTELALTEAIKHGHLARTKLTANHPRIFYGYSTWAETVARLREVLLPLGWEKSDKGNYELAINVLQDLAIAVATGDECTGLQHLTPSNKCPKGTNTIEAININNQIDLFAELIPAPSVNKDSLSTWILLYHFATDEIRCELSLPSEIGSDGRIKSWKERIILKPILLDETSIEVRPPENPDIDIKIKRKAS